MTTRPLFYRNPSLSRASFSTFVLGLGLAIMGLASLFSPESFQCLGQWMGQSISQLFGHPAHQFVQPPARG
jgi:hypothetical protein